MLIQEKLQSLTEKSLEEKLRTPLSEKVIRILDQAEAEAKSGSGKYYICIDTPEQSVLDELNSLKLLVFPEGEKTRVSWYRPKE